MNLIHARNGRWLLCSVFLTSAALTATEAPSTKDDPSARVLILVRHGHYDADPEADEKLGPGLSPLGVAQAHLLGARLSGLPGAFDKFYVSPLQRARDTAATIASAFPGSQFQTLADLQECTPPTRRKEIIAEESAEDLAACAAQLERLFAERFRPAKAHDRQELMVCHGNVIRYLVTKALGVDSTAWLEMSVGHASITKIRIEADGSFKVIAVGDVGHLPANLLTGASGDVERDLFVPTNP